MNLAFIICVSVLLAVIVSLLIWSHSSFCKKIHYVYNNQEAIYFKMLETEIVSVSMYLRALDEERDKAIKDEKYELVKKINSVYQNNLQTLDSLKNEYKDHIERKIRFR